MTYIECFFVLSLFAIGLAFIFGVAYPAVMVIWYKLSGSELSVNEILRRI